MGALEESIGSVYSVYRIGTGPKFWGVRLLNWVPYLQLCPCHDCCDCICL